MMLHPFEVPLKIATFVHALAHKMKAEMFDPPEIAPQTPTPPTLVAQLLLLATVALFLAVLVTVSTGGTRVGDEWTLRVLRMPEDSGRAVGPPWLTDVVLAITALGEGPTLTAFVLLAAGWFFFRGDRRALRMMLVVGIGGLLLMLALKYSIGRPRPDIVPHLSRISHGSFPSGHAMMTMAIFLSIAVLVGRGLRSARRRSALVLFAVVASLCIGSTRVFVGVHYPSDVLAGWMIGLAWAAACWLIDARTQGRSV